MKARIKATDEIIEVDAIRRFSNARGNYIVYIDVRTFKEYGEEEVDTKDLTTLAEVRHMHTVDPNYWTRLEHQYAGMAMQGLMSNVKQISPKEGRSLCDEIVDISFKIAYALVEKYKKEEK